MKILDVAKTAAAPYMLWIKIGVVVALIVTVAGWVRYYGHTKFEAGEAKSAGVIEAKNRALKANARAFGAFADKFRDIDANTLREIEAAELKDAEARIAAQQAERDRIALAGTLQRLDEILEREKQNCQDGRKPICGVPLR